LIELMMVITIIGVVVAFSFLSYNKYIRSAAGVDAQSQMLKIAGELEHLAVKKI
jgi:prepilin-type N-terminal cleavage/methylation domain-containing protein